MMDKTWNPAVKWIEPPGLPYRQTNPHLPPSPCAKCGDGPCIGCVEYREWVAGCFQIIRRLFLLPVRPIKKRRDQDVRSCLDCPMPDVDMGACFQCPVGRPRAKKDPRGRKSRMSNEQLAEAVEDGKTDKEIGELYKLSESAVYARRKKLGLYKAAQKDPCVGCRTAEICGRFGQTCSEKKNWDDMQRGRADVSG